MCFKYTWCNWLVVNHFALILAALDFFSSIGEPDFVFYHNEIVKLVIEVKTI
jgi:hypothetical protein